VDFLAAKQIISAEKTAYIRALSETDPKAAQNLLNHAERLGRALRTSFRAILKGQDILREWVQPINQILRVTEGHDELQSDGSVWRLGFVAREEGLEWLLAAIARSGAELIAGGSGRSLKKCTNADCRILKSITELKGGDIFRSFGVRPQPKTHVNFSWNLHRTCCVADNLLAITDSDRFSYLSSQSPLRKPVRRAT
jgi:hypothetical protein